MLLLAAGHSVADFTHIMKPTTSDTILKIGLGMILAITLDDSVKLMRGEGTWWRTSLPVGLLIMLICQIIRDATTDDKARDRWRKIAYLAAPFYLIYLAGFFGLIKR